MVKAFGKFLRRCVGHEVGGLHLERVGDEGGRALWRVIKATESHESQRDRLLARNAWLKLRSETSSTHLRERDRHAARRSSSVRDPNIAKALLRLHSRRGRDPQPRSRKFSLSRVIDQLTHARTVDHPSGYKPQPGEQWFPPSDTGLRDGLEARGMRREAARGRRRRLTHQYAPIIPWSRARGAA